MQSTTAATVYLKDYTVPAFLIPEVELDISLFEDDTRVRAKLVVERNGAAADPRAPLALDIDELTVESVALNGVALTPDRYKVDARHLTIPNLPDRFELTTVSRIVPKKNTKLMGIYTSHTGFFSLCEAEGFRRITPFLDRPDVMARYTVTLHADRERYPVLLANGNLSPRGRKRMDAIGQPGRTHSRNLPICLPWWPPASIAAPTALSPDPARKSCCSSLWSPASSTRAPLRSKPSRRR
jgi:aminopeptidase N